MSTPPCSNSSRNRKYLGLIFGSVFACSVVVVSVFVFSQDDSLEMKSSNIPIAGNVSSSSGTLPKVIRPPPLLHMDMSENNNVEIEEVDGSMGMNSDEMESLWNEFEAWMETHSKTYMNDEEKERRFAIWMDNHEKTIAKNLAHGPCKMTEKQVFGSNHFKDLTAEEFQSKYLTGYTAPREDEELQGQRKLRHKGILREKSRVNDPRTVVRDQSVQERYLKEIEDVPLIPKEYFEKHGISESHSNVRKSYHSCSWFEVACNLRKIFAPVFGSNGESKYSYAYPEAIDYRSLGAVTSVHSQGNCGACWAITATETIESAYFLSKGKLYELSESEVITCDDSCAMCSGGWPQNAYSYVITYNGLPLEKSLSYDGDFLTTFSSVSDGESDEFSQSYIESYKSSTCPAEGSNKYSRYAPIKSYGYATDRCLCYTDGSGCDCDEQNEAEAIMNIASFGPASVCLEASTWQDYTGGIITSESGCTSEFLDMNHCVQVVGYAFTTDSDNSDEERKSGSSDDSQREGYWIVKNQWSSYWGMNGYAYLAMGENTCGVLNDMTQAFAD